MITRLRGSRDAIVSANLHSACLYLTLLTIGITYLDHAQVALGRHNNQRHHDFDRDHSLLIDGRMSLVPLARSRRSATSTTTTTRPDKHSTTAAESAIWWQKYLQHNVTSAIDHLLLDRVFELTPGHYAAGDVAHFLEGHQALKLHDPRAYFTDERTSRSLAILLHELPQVPARLRFAFVVRVFHELGRKLASKLDTYHRDALSLLSKKSDDLGTKPEVSTYLDVIARSFESKEDSVHPLRPERTSGDLPEVRAEKTQQQQHPVGSSWADKLEPISHNPIEKLLATADHVKRRVWNASLNEIAIHFAHTMSFFVVNATRADLLPRGREQLVAKVLSLAFTDGARVMLLGLQASTRHVYAAPREAIDFFKRITSKCLTIFKDHVESTKETDPGKLVRAQYEALQTNSYADLNPLNRVDLPTLGPWNARIYDHLGSSERVLKLFASLVSRVPREHRHAYLRLHLARVKAEFARTVSGFISLMSSPLRVQNSEYYLLRNIDKTAGSASGGKPPEVRESYQSDKDRVPARCYLAGRRWRLYLRKALTGYTPLEDLIQSFVDQINLLKANTPGQRVSGATGSVSSHRSSHDMERLCLPRLEMGLKGWGINGEPPSEADAVRNKFPLRNPIEGLNMDEDPFTSGARLGYRLGFMIGYNRHRNTSLELESRAPKGGGDPGAPGSQHTVNEKARQTAAQTASYLSKTAYWSGLLIGARKTLEIATREGYLATLKVSLRAGMLLPLEAGSRLAAIKSSSFAGQLGGQAGREYVNEYLMGRDSLDEQTRRQLLELGATYGSLAGQTIGENLGAIVGREAALEAYRRTVSRGGKVTRAKFHLDEYAAGAKVGFDFGLTQGARVASSSSLDPSAPREFKFEKPEFSAMVSQAFGELDNVSRKVQETNGETNVGRQSPRGKSANQESVKSTHPSSKQSNNSKEGSSRSALIGENSPATSNSMASPMDRWEKDLITPLTVVDIEQLHAARNHTRVFGLLKGKYTVLREVKRGMQSVSNSNRTYDLEVQAIGFMMNNIAYLSLAGTIENANVLHGSLIARDLIKGR